jgi:choline dehydrogenase-like flavoprotein
MIRDLAESCPSAIPDYDVCIVGSGPAGITVARELSTCGLRLCVLESGRARPTPQGDRLRAVRSEGIRIKDYSRERVFGGASTTWAGLSSPLDPIDLEPRPFLGRPGWPLVREELLHFYAEACRRYRFAPLEFFGPLGFGALRANGEVLPEWDGIDEKVFLAAAAPQNFAAEHRAAFERDGVDLYLDATVLRLEGERSSGRVERASLRTTAGRELRVRANAFVVAAGGIENARLLLVSRDLCDRGLGNEHDQVGRCLMNHPKNYHGILHLARPLTELPFYFGCLYQGYAGYAGLRLPESVQRERGLLNSYVRLEPLFPWSGSEGVESLVAIVKRSRFALRAFQARRRGKVVTLRDYSETGDDSELQNERKTAIEWLGLGWNVVRDSPRVSRYVYHRLLERSKPPVRAVRLRNFMEMEPDPENRVLLSDERDPHGQRVPIVRHRCTELDKRSLVAVHAALARELPRVGLGRLETGLAAAEPWPIDQDASHHMGTTRMGADARSSVVDSDCRVHTVPNLYVAGASVLPTSGCANPTFTLVALAIRLARLLERSLARRDARAVPA